MNIKSFCFVMFLMFGGLVLNANAQSGYGYSYIERIPANQTVYAETGTVLSYSTAYYYDPGIQPALYKDNALSAQNERIMAPGYASVSAWIQVNSEPRKTYKIHGDHYVGAFFYQVIGGQPRYIDYFGYNHFAGDFPTPYGFSQGPTGYYYYRIYKVATTFVSIQIPQPAPQISLDVAGAVPGQSGIIGLRGANLFGNSQTIQVSGNGVTMTVQPTAPNNIEYVDVNLNVAENAEVGVRDVTLTVDGQVSNTVSFRVGDRTPQITSISPAQANTGNTVPVTITGSNFGFNPLIRIDGTGINPTITSATSTQINAIFSVADATYVGTRGIRVVSRGISGTGFGSVPGNSDTSNPVNFDVFAPSVQIADVPIVEKNGERTVNITVLGLANSSDEVKFKLRPIEGATGEARFSENNSTEIRKGNGSYVLAIKGITESSAINKMTIEATPANAANVLAHKEFTVAVITSLTFEKFDADYTNLDDNPGTDGVVNPNGSEGLRIFPDKNSVADVSSTKDRALVKVKAAVLPSDPSIKVYFGSFDLDDPSANTAPIDTNGSNGNDNNGMVNTSTAGDFTIPTGINCSNPPSGHILGRIECDGASNGIATAAFKTTMQPGDNFAIAASLVGDYRAAIRVNASAGENLINNANQVIPISGEANPNNVQGIRTKMLTVWRKLHIEVDSMGQAHENYVRGSIPTVNTILRGQSRTINVTAPSLEGKSL